MLNLKKLGAAIFLTCALGLTAWADCPDPGVMGGPPCPGATQMLPTESTQDDSIAPAIMNGPPAVTEPASVELPSLAEIALSALMLF